MNKSSDNKQNTSNDEIDLGLLILKIIKRIRINIKVILLLLIFSLLSSLAYYFKAQPEYKSTMIINSTILTKENVTNLIESLQELINDGNYDLVNSQLHLADSTAYKISEITVEEVNESTSPDNPENPDFLEITVLINDVNILPQLEKGIINFLEKNHYANRREILKIEKLKALIDKTEREIDQIDSLKYEINEGLIVKSQSPNVVMMEPVNIYTASVALFEKKQEYKTRLELASGVHILKGFTALKHPVSPKLMLCLIVGLGIGLAFAIIAVFVIEVGVYLRRLNKEYYSGHL